MSEINDTEDLRLSARVSELLTKADDAISTAYVHAEKVDNPHLVTKEQVGLGNVDNTADIEKPVSMAVATAIREAKLACNTYTDGEILESEALCKAYADDKAVELISACNTFATNKIGETKTEVTAKIAQVETDLAGLGESMVQYVTGINDRLPACMKVDATIANNTRLVGILFQQPLPGLDTTETQYLYRKFKGVLLAVECMLSGSQLPVIGTSAAYPFKQPGAKHSILTYNVHGGDVNQISITEYDYVEDPQGWKSLLIVSGGGNTKITIEILSSAPKVQAPAPEVK